METTSSNVEILAPKLLKFPGIVSNSLELMHIIESTVTWDDSGSIRIYDPKTDSELPGRLETSLKPDFNSYPWIVYGNAITEVKEVFSQTVKGSPARFYGVPQDYEIYVSKYVDGGELGLHTDEDIIEETDDISIIWYLNGNYDGGELVFPGFNIEIKPNAGDMLVFPCSYPHYAKAATNGTKYISIFRTQY